MEKYGEKQRFVPTPGKTYVNNGCRYICLGTAEHGAAKMRNTATGWTLVAHGLWNYALTDEIEWDYSTMGHFE